ALQVQDAQVCLADRRNQLGCKKRPRRDREPLGDATADHRVAGERNLHVPKPYRPTSRTNRASATVRTRWRAPSRLQNRTTASTMAATSEGCVVTWPCGIGICRSRSASPASSGGTKSARRTEAIAPSTRGSETPANTAAATSGCSVTPPVCARERLAPPVALT